MGPSNAYVWEATGGGIIEEDPHICCKVSYSLLPALPSPFIGKPDSTHRWQCHPLQQPTQQCEIVRMLNKGDQAFVS